MKKKATVKNVAKEPEYPASIETFRSIAGYSLNALKSDKPTCFNGVVNVVKYKVTVEVIEEPIEVIHARLQELWDKSDNHHHYDPIKQAAAKHGYELQGSHGNSRVR